MKCAVAESQEPTSYPFSWFDWVCVWYPPAWLILFNRHWQHYKPDPEGWCWSEYPLFLLPGGFYLGSLIRWLRLAVKHCIGARNRFSSTSPSTANNPHVAQPDPDYQRAFREEVLVPIVKHYFRAELHNPENLPRSGPLIVALNHAGMCFPWDFMALALLLTEQHPWFVQPLAHPLFFDHPWLNWWLPQGWAIALGGVRADAESFEAAIAQKAVILYAPESWRGLAKGWRQRYKLATFDTSFVRLSLQYRVPILPVVCIGSERLHPFAFNVQWLARLAHMPMFPISPLIPVFMLFPSMGVWVARSRLQYYIQPLWQPWESLSIEEQRPRQTTLYRLAQELRSQLQRSINQLLLRAADRSHEAEIRRI